MDSVIINDGDPKLLQLVVWFDVKFEKNAKVSIQAGRRTWSEILGAPLLHDCYMPSSRVYFYDIAYSAALPVIQTSYNDIKLYIDLGHYRETVQNNVPGD